LAFPWELPLEEAVEATGNRLLGAPGNIPPGLRSTERRPSTNTWGK